MSEPGGEALEIREILPGLHHYTLEDDRIGTRSESYVLAAGGRLVLVDPLPCRLEAIERLGRVDAIVITASGHQRSAWRLRRLTGAPVVAPRDAAGLEETPDARYAEDERLAGGLRAVAAPGPRGAHQVLYHAVGPGILLLADLAMRGADGGLVFLPDGHLEDPPRARHSARRLLEYRFDALGPAHGEPLSRGGRAALLDLLRRDAGL
ncbi:MAG TPA: MBL fold metallo-hydrolase [Patescibacteria group bacterium]|nr:MBL fold metallo-hydrolase [Patescibacteria group bacterium]